MTETLQREGRISTYDDCRMSPVSAALRRSEIERNKTVNRLLNAWGVSNKPARKKHRAPLRKHRTIYRGPRHQYEPAHAETIVFLLATVKEGKRPSFEVELRTVFDRLSALKKIKDVADEYTFKPTERAYINTKLTIMKAFDRMGERFPKPRIVPDGEGGVVATWRRNGRRVRLRFQATGDDQDYIYYQSGDDYDVERPSINNLRKRLEWLNSV